eukprot:COSAG02_NODE_4801_length_4960_cov_3.266406_4_plen_228_part_00
MSMKWCTPFLQNKLAAAVCFARWEVLQRNLLRAFLSPHCLDHCCVTLNPFILRAEFVRAGPPGMLCVGRKIILCVASTKVHEQCMVNRLCYNHRTHLFWTRSCFGLKEPHKIGVWVAGAAYREWRLLIAWCSFVVVAVANHNGSEFDELVQYLNAIASQTRFIGQSAVTKRAFSCHVAGTIVRGNQPLNSCQTLKCDRRRSCLYRTGTTQRCATLDTQRCIDNHDSI